MTKLSPLEQVVNQLKLIVEPDLKKNLIELGFIENIEINNQRVSFDLLISEKDAFQFLEL